MTINKNWILTELAGEFVAVPIGENALTFHGIVKLNETGKLIWEALEQGDSETEIATMLTEKYQGLSKEKALRDVRKVMDRLRTEGLLIE